MNRPLSNIAFASLTILLVAACSAPPAASTSTSSADSSPAPANTSPTPADPASSPAAPAVDSTDPCSYLTSADVATAFGSAPVEIQERVGRGDCDYVLTAAGDAKVNVAVTSGADGEAYLESIRPLGDPTPADLGDESFSIFNEGFGTVLVVKTGSDVVAVQAFLPDKAAELPLARALAEVILSRL